MIYRNQLLSLYSYYVNNYKTIPLSATSSVIQRSNLYFSYVRKSGIRIGVSLLQRQITMTSTTTENDVRTQKQLLRKEVRANLKLLSNDEIEQQSRAVWEQLHNMKIYQQAKSIGLFLSMPTGEIKTSYAVQHAINSHKDIFIPQVGKNFELPDMDLIQIQCSNISQSSAGTTVTEEPIYSNWPKNKWNIPEPPDNVILKTAQPGDIDLLIVPGLAFDAYGNRLGQGKGYYDRFMARMCNSNSNTNDADTHDRSIKSPILVAVALQCQFIDTNNNNDDNGSRVIRSIPVHEHDFPVNWIILPNETIEIPKK